MSHLDAYNGATGAKIKGPKRHAVTPVGVFTTARNHCATAGPAPRQAFKPQTNSL